MLKKNTRNLLETNLTIKYNLIMKKITFLMIMIALTTVAFSQSEKYTKAMTGNISQMDSAKSADDMLSLTASFERIGDAEKTQWLPYYYAALCETLYALRKN